MFAREIAFERQCPVLDAPALATGRTDWRRSRPRNLLRPPPAGTSLRRRAGADLRVSTRFDHALRIAGWSIRFDPARSADFRPVAGIKRMLLTSSPHSIRSARPFSLLSSARSLGRLCQRPLLIIRTPAKLARRVKQNRRKSRLALACR